MSTHGPGGPTDTPRPAPTADDPAAAAGRALVEFWGTRGSIPTPGSATQRYGGNSSCVALDFGGELFICDAGTGIRALGVELARNAAAAPVRAHLFFSHSHWDHIQGFPFFTPAYDPRSRITVYGNHAGPGCMYDLLSGQMQAQYFPVSFRDLGAVITRGELGEAEGSLDEGADEAEAPTGRAAMSTVGLGRLAGADEALHREGVEINGVRVRIFRGRHPGGSIAYRFEHQGLSVVYSTDNELDAVLLNHHESLRDLDRMRKAPLEFVDFAYGADLLIGDAQYTDQEYPRRVGWGHARANTLVDLAVQAEVKRLSLYHHDPLQTDVLVDQKVEEARARAIHHGETQLEVSGARERVQLRLR